MKIDSHVHVTPPDISADWKRYAKREPHFSLLSNAKYNLFASAEDVLSIMKMTMTETTTETEQNNFDKAVIFGFAFQDHGLCRYVNDYVIEKISQYPDKFIGFAVTAPGKGRKGEIAAKEIERCYKAGLKGVGELFPQGQNFSLENKKDTMAVCGICKELNIPLLLHTNETVGHYYAGKSNIELKQTETFVKNNPDLKIILAHWGGGILFYETMKEIKESFKNVYYDTSISPFLYDKRIYNTVKALELCSKIIFGSDFPVLPPSRYLDDIKKSSLSENEIKMILGENAKNLLF
ncbi:MAG: amidohydrolase family protein [Treponema sp.]|nr:amidohydrolase family protein [Treponema sp.]